jgi:protease-4
MKVCIAVALLALAGLVLADDKSTSDSSADSKPAASKETPTGDKSAKKDDKLPSPGELIRKLKRAQQEEKKKSKIAYFNLSRPIMEKPLGFSLFGGDNEFLTLRSIIDRLHEAGADEDVKGVLITFGAASSLNFSQAQELRDTLGQLKKAGKQTFVYADSYDTDAYTVASGASKVCMLEGGEIMIPGVGLETTFYKGLFDKVGVQADYIQIGEYKGADEEYTRTAPSEELKGELSRLTQGLYDQIIDGISDNRNLKREEVQQVID